MTLWDPMKVPFSVRESFHAVSRLEDGFWLRSLRGGDEHVDQGRLLRMEAVGDWALRPERLTAGGVAFAWDGPDRLVIEGDAPVRLVGAPSRYDYAQAGPDGVHVLNCRQDLRMQISVRRGSVAVEAPWDGVSAQSIAVELVPERGRLEAAVDLFRVVPFERPLVPLEVAAAARSAEFAAFRALFPAKGDAADLAAYIIWSGYVPAEGVLTLPAIYMSKNWMTNIWSWDHCFVALALPDALAAEQMAVIFAAQDASGRLPDYLNDRFAYWSFTKPPVHGWTFAQLGTEQPELVRGWLAAQADSWLSGPSWNGLPAYRHGNDAGWDNATPFAEGAPLVTPDLATFLILQLEEIARLDARLGRDPGPMRERAKALTGALLSGLWTGEGFVARHLDGCAVTSGRSLLLHLPLLLGDRLTKAMRAQLVERLRAEHLTDWGLATEAPDSPMYRANGYWRGPIWAPTTRLFVDALDRCGATAFADEVARRFLRLCETFGMAENFDAQTGAGLHDPAFAWTSATYLALAARMISR